MRRVASLRKLEGRRCSTEMIRGERGAELSCGLSVGKGLVTDGIWKKKTNR